MDLDRLDAVPLLADLPFADRAVFAAVARETRAEAGDVLAHEGVFEFALIAIDFGEAELLRDGQHVARLTAGDVIGEVGALDRRLASMTVVAGTAMALITISALDLRRLRHSEPAAVARMQGMLLRRRGLIAS